MHPALFINHRVAQVARGHDVVLRRAGQLIAGDLFDHELVVGQIFIQRVDDPIAVGPGEARLVFLEAIGVGVARGIKPVAAPALPIMRRGQQPLDEKIVRVGCVVRDEGVHFFDGRRQPDQVERQAADQRDLIGFRRRLQTFFFETRKNERVERRDGRVKARRRERRFNRSFEGPMVAVDFRRGLFLFDVWSQS